MINKLSNNIIAQTCSFKGNYRKNNEDELFHNIDDNEVNIKLFSIFDGHGGDKVSKFLLKKIEEISDNIKNNY
jgi:serine/threonine protein phosphatase PrpC